MPEIHPTMARLYRAAAARGLARPSDVAAELNTSQQRLKNWDARGISADGAIEVQAAMGINAVWVMRGEGAPDLSSHPMGLDAARLATVLEIVEGAIADSRKKVPQAFKASMVKRVYDGQHLLNADTAPAVRAALAGLLESFGTE